MESLLRRIAVHLFASTIFLSVREGRLAGDVAPVHLITRKAFAICFRLLKPDGILARTSPTAISIEPLMRRAVHSLNPCSAF
jgi:hypothetical protein